MALLEVVEGKQVEGAMEEVGKHVEEVMEEVGRQIYSTKSITVDLTPVLGLFGMLAFAWLLQFGVMMSLGGTTHHHYYRGRGSRGREDGGYGRTEDSVY